MTMTKIVLRSNDMSTSLTKVVKNALIKGVMSESAESFFNPEMQMTADLVRRLQAHKLDAEQLQNDLEDGHARALQPMRLVNYLTYFPKEQPQIPAKHHRLIFGPQYGKEPYAGITRVIVRYPDTTDDFYPDAVTGRPWGDTFLEVIDEHDKRQNYLLNNKGLVAFDNAEIDVVEDMDFDITGDLFAVYRASEQVDIRVDLFGLSYILSDPMKEDSYVYQLQTNELDPPVIDGNS